MKILGICGGSGAGKTTLVGALLERATRRACTVSQDWYYVDRGGWTEEMHSALSFDEPRSIELGRLERDLRGLAAGRPVEAPVYCFHSHRRIGTQAVAPMSLVFVEGTLIFHDPGLRRVFDYKIFLDAADHVRFGRRLRRDVVERGRSEESILQQYAETVRPMYDRYVAPQVAFADEIIDASTPFRPELLEHLLNRTEARAS